MPGADSSLEFYLGFRLMELREYRAPLSCPQRVEAALNGIPIFKRKGRRIAQPGFDGLSLVYVRGRAMGFFAFADGVDLLCFSVSALTPREMRALTVVRHDGWLDWRDLQSFRKAVERAVDPYAALRDRERALAA